MDIDDPANYLPIFALSQHTFGTKTSDKTTVVNAMMSPEKTAASALM